MNEVAEKIYTGKVLCAKIKKQFKKGDNVWKFT
jgi:hypothetical protein